MSWHGSTLRYPSVVPLIDHPSSFADAIFQRERKRGFALAMSLLLDLCGVLALVVGISTGEITFALGIGYSATAIGGVFAISVVVCDRQEARGSEVELRQDLSTEQLNA